MKILAAYESMHQHSSEPAGKPLCLFGVGPSDAVQPHGTWVFSGLVRADRRSGRVERFTRRVRPRHGDCRDRTQIVGWAEGTAVALTPAAA